MSLKAIGQDREVNLWKAENQQGIIVVHGPSPDIVAALLRDDPGD